MRAVRLHGVGDLRVEDIAAPAPPRRDEVSLDVAAAGICGSDLHNFRTGEWISRAPSVAGHEFTGTVTSLGAGVRHVSVGDRVIVDSRHVCGDCAACRAGRAQVCESLGFLGEAIDGGFAGAVTLPARNALRAPHGVADRHLAMAEPLAVALHALNRLDADSGAGIVIAGCGAIGGLVALLAADRGHPVGVIDR
ncbi:MAG: alcohol dehydrogenase catalytic domain-containing protein, partial [Roseovarius sp.]|nr:alcohol dehydrogenase catalytic domain-containing protein [Roseovarius sp.]